MFPFILLSGVAHVFSIPTATVNGALSVAYAVEAFASYDRLALSAVDRPLLCRPAVIRCLIRQHKGAAEAPLTPHHAPRAVIKGAARQIRWCWIYRPLSALISALIVWRCCGAAARRGKLSTVGTSGPRLSLLAIVIVILWEGPQDFETRRASIVGLNSHSV